MAGAAEAGQNLPHITQLLARTTSLRHLYALPYRGCSMSQWLTVR